jgi:hypothetical protein
VQAYLPPFRNALINGDMRINQRGTSTNLASLTAVATTTPGSWVTDRWNVYRPGFVAGASIGQGTGMVYADLPFSEAGITTHARVGRTAANAATTAIYCDYNMESQDSYRLVGKTVTLSFYYRTGTNFSDNSLTASLHSGTATDAALRSGTFTSFATTAFAKSASWVRATVTGTVPTSAAQVCLRFSYTPVGTAGNADHFDVTGVQLELGSIATPFEVRPFSVELQMCQRYFEKSYSINTAPGTNTASGLYHISTTTEVNGYVVIMIKFTVAKRNNTYNALGYRADGVTNQWYYERSGAASFATPGFDQKSESNFRLLLLGTLAFTPSVIIGHWVADAEI